MAPKNPHIIIIGAGVSGIAAARRLLENGYVNTTILEAEKRIGGRINTIDFNGSHVELGAQWCHGEDGNIVYNLVKDLNMLDASFNTYTDFTFYSSSGKRLNNNVTDRLREISYEITYDVARLQKESGSFGEYFLKRYDEYVNDEFKNDGESRNLAKNMIDWFESFTLCYDSASSWFDISASGLPQYEECDGNLLLHWKNYGYSTILDVLMKTVPDKTKTLPIKDRIQLNKEVNQIIWNGKSTDKKLRIKCSDGTEYQADHVIVTTSLGVLKEQHKTMFNPELPLYKQDAIKGLGIGTVNKVFLKFPKKWWPDDCTGFSFIWNDHDKLKIRTEVQRDVGNDVTWLESIFGFYVIDSDPKTLMGWAVGKHAQEIENLPKNVVLNGCMYLLNKFLNCEYEIPQAVEVTWSKWGTNPHFKGSYSYRSVKSDKLKATAEELSLPITGKDGTLLILFGGEATHKKFYSSVHGAIESGLREAQRIVNFYMNPMKVKTKIAIVGAGMAGLAAAKTLIDSGVSDFVILEGRDKPGGRIETLNINGNIIELGAQWMHDTSTSLYKLAVENNLIAPELSEEGLGIYIRDDGYIFDNLFVKKIDFIVGQLLEECEKFVDEKNYPKSVGDFLQERFLQYLDDSGENSEYKERAMELFDWHVRFQIIDNSCLSLGNVSAKDWGKYSCTGEDGQNHLNLRNGYQSLVDLLVQNIPKENLWLHCPVLDINYNQKDITLNCQYGKVIIADHVVITSSVGYLKQNLLQFYPELPKNVSNSINNIGFHGIGKIFLIFEKKWWHQDGVQLIWRKDAVSSFRTDRRWLNSLTGFDCVLNQPNMLMGWIGGDGTEEMEKLPEETVGECCVDLLRMFLKDCNIPYPKRVIRSTWTTCPWIRGGYSHTTPDCDQSGFGPSTLSNPLEVNGVPKLIFAGEATHESHFSTTHGAFESGERAAGTLLNIFRKHKL